MAIKIDTRYPSIDDLRNKARKKIPKFAFEFKKSWRFINQNKIIWY